MSAGNAAAFDEAVERIEDAIDAAFGVSTMPASMQSHDIAVVALRALLSESVICQACSGWGTVESFRKAGVMVCPVCRGARRVSQRPLAVLSADMDAEGYESGAA